MKSVIGRLPVSRNDSFVVHAMLKCPLLAGFALIWLSVAVIPVGTHFRVNSPNYIVTTAREIGASNPGLDITGTQMMIGSWFAVPFMIAYCVVIGGIFTTGALVIHDATRRNSPIGRLAAGVFAVGCLIGAIASCAKCWYSFSWGYDTLGVGYLLAALALSLGVVGSVRRCVVVKVNAARSGLL